MTDINKSTKKILEDISNKTIFDRIVMRGLKSISVKYKCNLRVEFDGINPRLIERASENTYIINDRSFETAKVKAFISSMKAGNIAVEDNNIGTNLLAACTTTLNNMIERGEVGKANTLKNKLEEITKQPLKGVNHV